MTLATKLILIATLVLSIILPFGYYLIGEKNKKRYKRAIGTNAFFYFGAFLVASIMMFGGNVQAAEAATSASIGNRSWIYRCRSCYRFIMYRWWYRRCQCC